MLGGIFCILAGFVRLLNILKLGRGVTSLVVVLLGGVIEFL